MKPPLRRPALAAAIAVISAIGALVQLLPAPHDASIDTTRIVPLEASQSWFPER